MSSEFESRLSAEIGVLQALCEQGGSKAEHAELIRTIESYQFIEPEHQVLFESICTLFKQPAFSAALLGARLNNRGFPDIDLEKYFVDEPPGFEQALILARTLASAVV